MADLIPLLVHLPGPDGVGEIRLDRFSPNFFDAERLGFTNVRPVAPYKFIYDFPDDVLFNLGTVSNFLGQAKGVGRHEYGHASIGPFAKDVFH